MAQFKVWYEKPTSKQTMLIINAADEGQLVYALENAEKYLQDNGLNSFNGLCAGLIKQDNIQLVDIEEIVINQNTPIQFLNYQKVGDES